MVRTSVIILGMLLLVGCSSSIESQTKSQKPKELEVTLESNVKQVKVNEKVIFTSNVMYGNEDISDEAEVAFEVIENGVSYGNLPVEPSADGIYQLELKFSESGEHQVISHVTYKDFHEMPILSLEVEE